MGRQLDLADRMRRTRLPVSEVAGWQTRGSATFSPRGSVDHDTVGAPTGNAPSLGIVINGRPDLPGPLYNVLVARDCTVYVVAAGRANHAGGGGWRGLAGNSTVWGVALENLGTDEEPITAKQWDALARVHAELARGSFDPGNTCQHFEWAPTRKRDAWRADPAAFRQQQQHYLDHPPAPAAAPQEDDMPKTTLATDPAGSMWALTVGALHLGRAHVPDPARLADILYVDSITGGSVLTSQQPSAWSAEQLAAYHDVNAGIVVAVPPVKFTPGDIAEIARQVAELASLSAEDMQALVKAAGQALANG